MLPEHDRDSILRQMMPGHRERMGRMAGWARRAILAYADQSPDDLDVVLLGLEGWDDSSLGPNGEPYPGERYEFALKEIARQVGQWEQVARMRGVLVPPDLERLRSRVEVVTPERFRDEVLALMVPAETEEPGALTKQPPGRTIRPAKPSPVVDVTGRGLPELCAAAVSAAGMLTDTVLFPSYQDARYILIRTILDCDRAVIGAPAAESITSVSDDVAIDLVKEALDINRDDVLMLRFDDQPISQPLGIPRDRSKQGLHEIEMIALVKSYLLQYPDPTPEQKRELRSQVRQILLSAPKLYPQPRKQQRVQPKRASRKRRKK